LRALPLAQTIKEVVDLPKPRRVAVVQLLVDHCHLGASQAGEEKVVGGLPPALEDPEGIGGGGLQDLPKAGVAPDPHPFLLQDFGEAVQVGALGQEEGGLKA
jgi:hypothetical protein